MTPGAAPKTPAFWRFPVPTGNGHCGFRRTVANGTAGRAAVRAGEVFEACMVDIPFLITTVSRARRLFDTPSIRT